MKVRNIVQALKSCAIFEEGGDPRERHPEALKPEDENNPKRWFNDRFPASVDYRGEENLFLDLR